MCAVKKPLQITLYPAVIMIKMGSRERERERGEREKRERESIKREEFILFQSRALFGMKHNMYPFRSNNYYLIVQDKLIYI